MRAILASSDDASRRACHGDQAARTIRRAAPDPV